MNRTKAALQEGIYFRHGQRPPAFFMLLLLAQADKADPSSVNGQLASLWEVYAGLKEGRVRDLPGVRVPDGNLGVLLGFGSRAKLQAEFTIPDLLPPRYSDAFPPQYSFAPMKPGNPIVGSPEDGGICYSTQAADLPDLADVAFAVQFTADTPLAVERGVVETWKLLRDEGEDAALEIVAVFSGSQRDDGRSWIDFHDGLSNLKPAERVEAIVIGAGSGPRPAEWTINGSYLAFIRLGIDLALWRDISDSRQERLVGRDKLNGCPLVSFGHDDNEPGVPAAGCPVPGTLTVDGDNPFRDPPPLTDPSQTVAAETHMRRTNQRRPAVPASDVTSFRIFRQGYPYLEPHPTEPFRVGLNFVSFQNSPERLIGMLTTQGWLGGTNFGGLGDGAAVDFQLLTAYAAAMFFVPPFAAADPFPGYRLLAG
jgi:deferrochelatase/peroxidase EfeB